ncbi:DUF3991 and toprim domain-containing protein [Anaerosolibacter sp.]|uniref:DUF3991 and toprim domain-containing protein n=1 Tax=Anaerosolibacter sp. TaxID=1872527 RepID=UPI0039F0FFC3
MYKVKRFSEEEICRANQVNILAYAESIGLKLKKVGRSYKVKNYGGLYIDADGYKWNWFSQNKGGGPIQFVMVMEGKNWVDAIYTLLGVEKCDLRIVPNRSEERVEFKLPEKNDTFKHIIAYLIRSRGIDKEVVYDFINREKIYENKNRSCVFVGYDENKEPKYASVRSTNTTGETYRGDVKNSDKTFPFCYEGTSNTVCVFEAPIDLMSYLSLLKYHEVHEFRHHMISLGGVADKALDYYLKLHPEIERIVLCIDNDEAGHFACERLNEKYHDHYKILRHSPIGKDFNDDMLSINNCTKLALVKEPTRRYVNEIDTEEEIEF